MKGTNVDTNCCIVCLKAASPLRNAWETDPDNVKFICKLSSCVPEVEWNEQGFICQTCIDQLEVASAFRDLCLQSDSIRKIALLSNEDKNYDDLSHVENDSYSSDSPVSFKKDSSANCIKSDVNIERNALKGDFYNCKICAEKLNDRKALAQHNEDTHNSERPYDCIYCDKDFKTSSDLYYHEQIHLDERSYKCEECNTAYNTSSSLKKHRTMKHTQQEKWKYACDISDCQLIHTFKSNLDAHRRVHPNNFICYYCNKNYSTKKMLATHIRFKHGSTNLTKECTVCNNVYINKTILKNHMRKAHNIGSTKLKIRIKKYECAKCFKMYTTEKSMKLHYNACDGIKRHVKQEGSKNESDRDKEKCNEPVTQEKNNKIRRKIKKDGDPVIYKCEICTVVFSSKYLLTRHVRNVHATEKNHNCDICGQKFASPVYLSAHKRYHSGERPHICSFCGKGYITASDLYHHEKIHANKRAYKCEKCPKAFNTSSDLHKHKICVHLDRSEWKYVCTFCNRRFPLKTNLDTHTKTHTGERNFACHLCERRCINRSVLLRHIESHSNVRSFKCNLCNQVYKYQKSLDIHMAKAHGIGDAKIPERVKKYFCHICPKSYFANNKLQKHIRTHTGERPFPCSICDKRFIDKSYVKQHMKTAHNALFPDSVHKLYL